MYCYQCEQTCGGVACTKVGVCGKDEQTAGLQDALVYAAEGIANYGHLLGQKGIRVREIDRFVGEVLFSTVTNVNFDPARLKLLLKKSESLIEELKNKYFEVYGTQEPLKGAAEFKYQEGMELEPYGIEKKLAGNPDVIVGLQELIMYGLKGVAAYVDHARILGVEDDAVYAFYHECLDFLSKNPTDVDALLGMSLKVGEINVRAMEMLDKGNTDTYGHPVPTPVRTTPVKGKAILVSGHDLKDLEEILKQTQGKGINVYTHGEMLPCHGYPGLKKYSHLVGNYGSAWQNQQTEFNEFPGAIVMTTNCIQKPKEEYKARIFTRGLVAWPGVTHIAGQDYKPVIDAALAAEGFKEDAPEKTIMVGFGRNAVLGVADKVIEAVKGGAIKHFFLVGGCDGAKPGRNYYTELVEKTPKDTVILTLACGKYRFNNLDLGDIGGIPRLLDIGQCNDAYSAVQIALALANAFETDVNGLPLSLILSWYEQKAVCILLSLLFLGVKNIRLGPTLPAFIKPDALNVLVEKFAIKPTTTPDEDLKAILG